MSIEDTRRELGLEEGRILQIFFEDFTGKFPPLKVTPRWR